MERKVKFTIDKNDVYTVYSGKPGCMCGCLGKYSYSSKDREYAGKERGYEVTDDEVSDLAIIRMVNRFNRMESFSMYFKDGEPDDNYSEYVFVETETRNNVIYFKKGSIKKYKSEMKVYEEV